MDDCKGNENIINQAFILNSKDDILLFFNTYLVENDCFTTLC